MNPTLHETQSDCQGATASGSHPPPHRISRLLALDYSWISRRVSSTRLLRLIEIFDRSEFEIEGGGPGGSRNPKLCSGLNPPLPWELGSGSWPPSPRSTLSIASAASRARVGATRM